MNTDLSNLQSREELIAALRASVQQLIEQTDAAADEAFVAAEADARRYAEEAYERYAGLVSERTTRLEELSDALVSEMASLSERARVLSDALDDSVASLREQLGLDAEPSEEPEERPAEEAPGEETVDLGAVLAALADSDPVAEPGEAEAAEPDFGGREGPAKSGGLLDLFRRRHGSEPADAPRRFNRSSLRWATPIEEEIAGAPEGVRMLVTEMRLAGESEDAIAARLEELGIEVGR